MSIARIAAALILANRHQIDGVTVEDFDLSSPEGRQELAARTLQIHRALIQEQASYELGSVQIESVND